LGGLVRRVVMGVKRKLTTVAAVTRSATRACRAGLRSAEKCWEVSRKLLKVPQRPVPVSLGVLV
jgi:hypothetical protein